jgi:hypothetical protein
MTRWATAVAAVLLGVSLTRPAPTGAHRLDEYLQAARIAVDVDRVGIELDLTPGVAVATSVLTAIDRDRDGAIADAEGEDYARRVIDALVLRLDGRPVRATLDQRMMPTWRELTEGTGVVRLKASVALPPVASGRHELFFRNVHRSDIGVYLVNALVPADDRLEITRQRRDALQHEVTIDFRVRTDGAARQVGRVWSVLAGLLVAAAFGVWARISPVRLRSSNDAR